MFFKDYKSQCVETLAGKSLTEETDGMAEPESDFEREFCKWFMKEFPSSASEPGDTCEEKVHSFLLHSKSKYEDILKRVYWYVSTHKLTHYVSSMVLGAAKYSVSISRSRSRKRGLKAEAGIEELAGMGMGMEFKKEYDFKSSMVQCVGDLKEVDLGGGRGEGVIEYEMSPVFRLICEDHKAIKCVLQRAICYYLKRNSKSWYDNLGERGKGVRVETGDLNY